jgi:hypothetical protein
MRILLKGLRMYLSLPFDPVELHDNNVVFSFLCSGLSACTQNPVQRLVYQAQAPSWGFGPNLTHYPEAGNIKQKDVMAVSPARTTGVFSLLYSVNRYVLSR